MNKILHRILLLTFLQFVTTSAQSPPIPLAVVTGHHVEAVAELSTYTPYLIDDKVSFAWRSEYLDINSSDDRKTPLQCDFKAYDSYHKLVKQSCDIDHYLIVDYQNDTRYCEVPQFAWQTINIGQLVTISVERNGKLICAV